MVRLPDARCLCRVRVTVSEPGPGRVLAPAGDPLLARGSQGAGALPCHQAHRPPTLINGLRFTQQLPCLPHPRISIMWHLSPCCNFTKSICFRNESCRYPRQLSTKSTFNCADAMRCCVLALNSELFKLYDAMRCLPRTRGSSSR